MTELLVHISKAKHEILAADSLVKVKDLWNKAEAVRQLGQAAKDPELVTYATEFKLRCERRLGEILGAMRGTGEIREGRRPTNYDGPAIVSLADIDIDPRLSSRAQRIASVPEEKFERVIAEAKDGEKELTRRAVEKLISGPHISQNTGESEWYTPEHIISAARKVLGKIDLDPASHEDAQDQIQATMFFSKGDDGLAQDWWGRVWLNPPYAQPLVDQFSEKLVHELHGGRVLSAITLTNNATETKWGQLLMQHAEAVCFPHGRIKFWHTDRVAAPLQGQMICSLRNDVDLFYETFSSIGRTLVAP